jgi:type I restriction enzyme S subunit
MTTVARVGSVRLGRQRSPDKHTGQFATKYLRAANITTEGLDLTDVLEMDFDPAERVIFALHVGDLVLAEASGSAAQVGRAAVWRGQLPNCCYQNTVIRFRPHAVLPDYALVVFRHYVVAGIFARTARGVGIQHLGGSRFADLPFPLPPINEQRRIAEAVERHSSELREAEASLRSALKRIEEQNREILAAAVVGELVELAEPGGLLNPGSQSDLGEAMATSPRFNPGDLGSLEVKDGPHPLPPGWVWARIDQIGEVTLGRQRSPQHHQGEHMRPYLRVANVFEDRIDTSDIFEMNFTPIEYETYQLKYGDILLNEGQSPELIGRPAMYRGEVPGACFQNTLIRFRVGPRVIPDYALIVFRHYMHSGEFRKIARWSTNIAHLGLERFRAMLFPLPPLGEQQLIAAEARRRLESSESQKAAILSSLDRLPEMERELLAAAVAGELVSQQEDDEPVAILMERVGPPTRENIESSLATMSGERVVTKRRRLPARRDAPTSDLAGVIRGARRPLPLPELFALAGYNRDLPEQVELFYLALRSELGHSIRQVGDQSENAMLEAIANAT